MSNQLKLALRSPSPDDYRLASQAPKLSLEVTGEIKTSELSEEDVSKLYKRAKEIAEKEEDEKEFFKREKSIKPPRKGETVKMPFPPPVQLEKPEQVLKEEQEARSELKVLRYMPEGENLETVPQMIVTFNQPMVPLTGVDDIKKYPVPVKMNPDIEGEWRWIGTKTVKWKPSHRMPKSTEFKVVIPKEGVKSELGCELKEEISFSFTTIPVKIKKMVPSQYEMVGKDAILYIEFNQKIDVKDIVKFLKVTNEYKMIPLELEEVKKRLDSGTMKKKHPHLYQNYQRCIKNGIEGQFIWIGFEETVKLSTCHTVTLSVGCPSQEGPRVTANDQLRRFTTYGPLQKISHYPTSDIVPNQGWSISFSNNLELDDFDPDRDVSIDPPIERVSIIPNGSSISINGQTKGATNYKVTLKESITDIYGQNLVSEVDVVFSVGRARQSMYGFFNNQMIVHDITMDKEPKFEVISINLAKIRVCVYQVSPWEYHKCGIGPDYSWYSQHFGYKNPHTVPERVNCGKLVSDKVITVVNRPDELITTEIDLRPFLQFPDDPCGQLFVYVEPDEKSWTKNEFRYAPRIKTWIQVTSLAVDAFSGPGGEVYTFSTTLTDGRPLDQVKFTYQPGITRYYKPKIQREKYAEKQVSVVGDNEGVAFFPKIHADRTGIMIAEKGNDVSFVKDIRYYARTGDQMLSYIVNDRNLYKPKETISVKGIFRMLTYETWEKKLLIPARDGEVKWICYDPRGSKIKEGTCKTNQFGSFFMTVDLPDNVNLGNGRIRFEYKGNNYDHYYKVQEFRTPEFSASAKVDPGPYFPGGVSIVEGKAEYFSGGGLSGCDVHWDVTQSETSYYPPKFSFSGFNFSCSYRPIAAAGGGSSRPSISYFGGRRRRKGRRRRRVVLEEESEGEDDGSGGGDDGRSGQLDGKTDGSGDNKICVQFDENKDVEIKKPTRVNCNVNIQDINRQVMSSSTSFLVHPSRLYVGIKKKKYFARKGDALPIDLIVTNVDGMVVEGVDIEMTIYNRYWERKGYNWKEKETKVAEAKFVSKKEPYEVDLKLDEGGTYYFVCKVVDEFGGANYSSSSLWVAGGKEKGGGSKVQLEVCKMIGNKTSFEVGDEAKILVSSPFSPAEGMMCVMCNGFVIKERFRIEEDSCVVSVPIRREYVPNVCVRVFLSGLNDRVDENTGRPSAAAPKRPAHAQGALSLSIPPKIQTLKVDVKPDREIMKPGEEGNVSIEITSIDPDYKGGKKTAVSLIIVDEAVLSLTGYELPHPISSFSRYNQATLGSYRFRSSVVMKDWNSIVVEAPPKPVFKCCSRRRRCCRCCEKCCKEGKKKKKRKCKDKKSKEPEPEPEEGGDDGDGEDDDEIEVRTDFKPLACFIHDSTTDENGKIVIPFKLPDNLTRYRVWVLAHHQQCTDMFGLGQSSIQAQLPVAIRPSLPRFLNFGDMAEFTVVVQNQTLGTVRVNLAVRMTNLRLTDEKRCGVQVEIPYTQRAEVRFPVRTHKCGIGRFQVIGSVVGMKFADAVEKELPIFTPSTSEAFAMYGELDGDGVVIQSVVPPEAVYNQFGGMTITTTSTALQALTDAFLYLYNYKFDCVEQISSRMLSINALQKFLYEFNVAKMPTKRQIQSVMDQGFKKIRGSMRSDGALGFWSLTSKVNVYLSIFVAHNLIRCKSNGYKVDETLLNRSKAFCMNVDRYIQMYCEWYGEYSKASVRAFALYVLTIFALNGELSGHEKDGLAKRAEELFKKDEKYFNHEGKVWLMFCLFVCSRKKGKNGIVVKILKWVMNNVEESPETAHFITSYGDDGKLVMLHSNRRTDGVILEALCHVDPSNYLIPKIVKGLLAHRKKGRWNSTQENVYILYALKKYFEVFEKAVPDFLCRVWLGEGYAGEVKFKGREVDFKTIDIPMKAMVPDEDKVEKKDLVIWKEGPGRLYYRLGMDYAPKSLDLKPVDYGFQVERTYEHVTDASHVKKVGDGKWEFKAGELIRVKLRLTNVSRRFHVALVDFIPAGCEVLNPELKGTQKVPVSAKSGMSSSHGRGYSPYRWSWWRSYWPWYEHINLRDERVEAFSSYLYCGTHEYEYIMRATSLGNFVVPPAKAEEMYSPELFGRSASEKVLIK